LQYRKLNGTDIDVSLICLGTMTWGSQNSEAEGHEQLDYAVGQGVNFIDTAEIYPTTPSTPENRGRTEEIIGTWLKKRGRRDDIILASKVAGPIGQGPGTGKRLDPKSISEAIEGSLRRLQTDYVDLYQVHWPDRSANFFGRRGLTELGDDPASVPIEETLGALGELIQAGKVRHIGVSNETPWGLNRYLRLAETKTLPRVATVQNAYNLLNRLYEVGLAEIGLREDVGLLAYSPLASGVLTGKYLRGVVPPGSRFAVARQFTRYEKEAQPVATGRYVALAHEHGLDPAQMALAFVNSRPFVTANIIGATSMEQLRTDIASVDVTLSAEVLTAIDDIQALIPDPCP
jgi:aryl-alcohol dehydrogenase-like predicted oxidoreductase